MLHYPDATRSHCECINPLDLWCDHNAHFIPFPSGYFEAKPEKEKDFIYANMIVPILEGLEDICQRLSIRNIKYGKPAELSSFGHSQEKDRLDILIDRCLSATCSTFVFNCFNFILRRDLAEIGSWEVCDRGCREKLHTPSGKHFTPALVAAAVSRQEIINASSKLNPLRESDLTPLATLIEGHLSKCHGNNCKRMTFS